jgi:hypothetical protein
VDHVARVVEGRDVYRILVGRPECKRPLGRPRIRWENIIIKINRRKIAIDGAIWIRLTQDRVQCGAFLKAVMKLDIP